MNASVAFILMTSVFVLKLKVVAIDDNLNVVHQNNVQFDSELPEFR